ncbi:MAG: oxidoreductase [Chloroflexaceae bacterium]|jgi:NAD-reducing hydrogenase small subunit|nr:oxidoreductase [Chloroflexaceae bacterium]
MQRARLATIWLGGCSGCHMSLLDMDEWLFELAQHVEVVYSPLVDIKEYPDGVDIALVEGAIANEDHLHLIRQARERTRTLIAFGDCAVTGNVTALRNLFGTPDDLLRKVYAAGAPDGPVPREAGVVPVLTQTVTPVHAVVPVEHYLPGCPPDAGAIRAAISEALQVSAIETQRK